MASILRSHVEKLGNEIIARRKARIEAERKDSNDDPTFVKVNVVGTKNAVNIIPGISITS